MPPSTRCHRRFAVHSFAFTLWRLSDDESEQLRSHSFPIRLEPFFLLNLELDERCCPDALLLPQVLLVLEAVFAPASTDIDSRKQSFAFPFLLAIEKNTATFYYLLRIQDYRGGLEFRFYRIIDDLKYVRKDLQRSHPPIAEEFANEEIEAVVKQLWRFLKEQVSNLPQPQPFFRYVDFRVLIYGYWEGKFVEQVIEEPEQYQKMVRTLEQRYGKPVPSDAEQVNHIRSWVESVAKPVRSTYRSSAF